MTDVEERELNMANALRRGPGWWMDPEGNWNPPEIWPESTPPLPDWVRDAEGRWHAPDDAPPAALTVVPEPQSQYEPKAETEAAPATAAASTIDTAPAAAPQRTHRTASSLSYAAYSKLEPVEEPRAGVTLKRALFAALGAAITSGMIGAGVTVLLGLF